MCACGDVPSRNQVKVAAQVALHRRHRAVVHLIVVRRVEYGEEAEKVIYAVEGGIVYACDVVTVVTALDVDAGVNFTAGLNAWQ